MEIPGHASMRTPRTIDRIPDSRADFHRCGSKLGTGWVPGEPGEIVMAAV
jgi:hypothetical protein